jgi:hypothetical protein
MGTSYWKTPTEPWSGVSGTGKSKGILMAKNGNFQIYNTTNSSLVSAGSNLVWQSWDHPTHTLVPGQALKRGQTLVSNSSATNTSAGSYKLVMEPGGLGVVLHKLNPGALLVYGAARAGLPRHSQALLL